MKFKKFKLNIDKELHKIEFVKHDASKLITSKKLENL